MKRYEKFNKTSKVNESAENLALQMLLYHIKEEYGLDDLDIKDCFFRYLKMYLWLMEEVEEKENVNE